MVLIAKLIASDKISSTNHAIIDSDTISISEF